MEQTAPTPPRQHPDGHGPLISVVTPVYNAESFLEATYQTLCRQTYSHWQWVVVNDGSTDGSGLLLKRLAEADKRIAYYEQANSGSAKQPRDRAVYESAGDFILPLDADDLLDDDYMEKMLQRQSECDADIVYPQMLFIEMETGRITLTLPSNDFDATAVYQGPELVKYTMPQWTIGCNGGLYRRRAWINMSYPHATQPVLMNSDEVDERIYQMHAGNVAFTTARYYYQTHQASITNHTSVKQFHTLLTGIQLTELMVQHYGTGSTEHLLAHRQCFYDWRNKAAAFAMHRDELREHKAEILSALRTSFAHLDPRLLTTTERLKFLNLCSFRLLMAIFTLKYRGRKKL